MLYDTNYWKSFIHARLAVAMGNAGCLSLFGDKPDRHRLFTAHLSSEYRVQVMGQGRVVDEWRMRPEHGDNHWFDGVVGCAVAASMQGSNLEGVRPVEQPKKPQVVDYLALHKKAREMDEKR